MNIIAICVYYFSKHNVKLTDKTLIYSVITVKNFEMRFINLFLLKKKRKYCNNKNFKIHLFTVQGEK